MKSLTYIEIDISFCALRYGETTAAGTCPAVLGVDSAIKCFNSIKTCAVRPSYLDEEVTLRFAMDTDYLPREIDAIPSIIGVEFTPATISLGENLGQRATLSVKFKDKPHSDTGNGFDKYRTERPYDPFKLGTFWGKFRARQPFLRGRAIRWITGLVGQSLAEMETHHFVLDSFDGPTPDGVYTLVAKDVLKLAAGDRSTAPLLSNGFLVGNITASATSATLSPVGIGNAEYPASGHVAIGGKEIVSFTRAGDVLTITRAQLGTVAAAHNAQDRVQLVLSYVGEDAADILHDLYTNYSAISPDFIPLADWQAETSNFLGTVYTAHICEPTSVETLASELIQQACLAQWWDDAGQKIRLQVLRGILTDAARFTPDNTLDGSLTIREQSEKRISQVRTYFGVINPLRPLSDLDNYRSTSVIVDADAEADYGSPAIKTIKSRWIPALGRTIADRLGTIQVGRYRDPPRRVTLDLFRYAVTDVVLGGGYRVESFCVQDETGAQSQIPVQVTRVKPAPDKFSAEAEEMLFAVPVLDLSNRVVIVDANNFNINLRAAHDSIYPAPRPGDVITCRILSGVVVGSISPAMPAFDLGAWPADVITKIVLDGRIQGAGGNGGSSPQGPGGQGGVAFFARRDVEIEMSAAAKIFGGGGGGGAGVQLGFSGNVTPGGGGGGGAGSVAGSGGFFGGSGGTSEAGGGGGVTSSFGTNSVGGGGGGPGLAGGISGGIIAGGVGGAPGAAIDGVSFVTITNGPGDIRGPQIN